MDERRVVIQSPTGREVSVTLDAYRSTAIDDQGRTYQQLGWRIARWETGEPYRSPSADPEAHGLPTESRTAPAPRRGDGK